jgi:hypothetical protein
MEYILQAAKNTLELHRVVKLKPYFVSIPGLTWFPFNSFDCDIPVVLTGVSWYLQDMTVIGTDYTFATRTGDFQLPFGRTADCGGEKFRSNCPYFGNAVINTQGTGLILDPNVRLQVLMSAICQKIGGRGCENPLT